MLESSSAASSTALVATILGDFFSLFVFDLTSFTSLPYLNCACLFISFCMIGFLDARLNL